MNTQKENMTESLEKEKVYFVETDKKVVRDRPIKSIFKAITWRIIASLTTFSTVMFFGDDKTDLAEVAMYVTFTDALVKILLYFLHERAWAQARWGRMLVKIRRNTPLSKNAFNKLFKVKKQ